MIHSPVLSICIASYNHGKELYEKINTLLSTNTDIEIVVSDNNSSDDTNELLSSIKSEKFIFVKNTSNLGPTVNYVKALSLARGKYALFLTDKDSINIANIDKVIDALNDSFWSMGYFVLNSSQNDLHIKYFPQKNICIKRFAYLSKHPSGYFFNNELMKKANIDRYSDVTICGVFPFEFIAADIALHGNCAILNIHFIKTAPICNKDKTISRSGTYSSASKNLFFDPLHRFEQYERYVKHLNKLDIGAISKLNLFYRLTKHTIKDMTKTFNAILSNKDMIEHYRIDVSDYSDDIIKKSIQKKLNDSQVISGLYRFIFMILWRKTQA